ncbi:MAG: MoaD/ThiS family protein [Nitrospira sp. CG24C]|nr:MAG: MoaD/ThiS family protein [Nitrospira sp. CG24C]TKB55780.1 MAG: MoaD/ThiS family protein [Nitrospira sp.]
MIVHIPGALRSYTKEKSELAADGQSLADVLSTLDRHYPGIRFRIITEQDRIRPHIRIFVNDKQIGDLSVALQPDDRIHIICALSGG